jgi:hypothetical protein
MCAGIKTFRRLCSEKHEFKSIVLAPSDWVESVFFARMRPFRRSVGAPGGFIGVPRSGCIGGGRPAQVPPPRGRFCPQITATWNAALIQSLSGNWHDTTTCCAVPSPPAPLTEEEGSFRSGSQTDHRTETR